MLAELRFGDDLAASWAVQRYYASGFDDLAAYLESLASDWRGWPGRREWCSREGELRISAVHERVVRLEV